MPKYANVVLPGNSTATPVEILLEGGDPFELQPLSSSPLLDLGAGPIGAPISAEGIVWQPPCVPTKIIGIGRNYAAHAKELGNPVPQRPLTFLKPPSSLLPHQGTILRPFDSALVHHEAEVAIIIGRRCRHVAAEDFASVIWGYTTFNDVTARDLQRQDVQFTRGKSFDTFSAIGPWVDTDFQPADQRVSCHVNGALRQAGRLSQMTFGIPQLVAWCSRIMTLQPGDIIATGTPPGVDALEAGDTVTVRVDGLPTLTNDVRDEG